MTDSPSTLSYRCHKCSTVIDTSSSGVVSAVHEKQLCRQVGSSGWYSWCAPTSLHCMLLAS
eukprot:1852652-Amphidinium_carterae.1